MCRELQNAKRLRLAIASLRLSGSDTGATNVPDPCRTVVLGRASVQLQIGNGKRGRPPAAPASDQYSLGSKMVLLVKYSAISGNGKSVYSIAF